jgi:hypothetical protein
MDYTAEIGRALLGTEEDKQALTRHITCNTAARTVMVCSCGAIHDERRIVVVEAFKGDKDKAIGAACPSCFDKTVSTLRGLAAELTQSGISVRAVRWDSVEIIEPQ